MLYCTIYLKYIQFIKITEKEKERKIWNEIKNNEQRTKIIKLNKLPQMAQSINL